MKNLTTTPKKSEITIANFNASDDLKMLKSAHFCINCGINESIVAISQRGYCTNCEREYAKDLYNAYCY